jgi:hypothetical protein
MKWFVVTLAYENDPESLILFNLNDPEEWYYADPDHFGIGELVAESEIDFVVFSIATV